MSFIKELINILNNEGITDISSFKVSNDGRFQQFYIDDLNETIKEKVINELSNLGYNVSFAIF